MPDVFSDKGNNNNKGNVHNRHGHGHIIPKLNLKQVNHHQLHHINHNHIQNMKFNHNIQNTKGYLPSASLYGSTNGTGTSAGNAGTGISSIQQQQQQQQTKQAWNTYRGHHYEQQQQQQQQQQRNYNNNHNHNHNHNYYNNNSNHHHHQQQQQNYNNNNNRYNNNNNNNKMSGSNQMNTQQITTQKGGKVYYNLNLNALANPTMLQQQAPTSKRPNNLHQRYHHNPFNAKYTRGGGGGNMGKNMMNSNNHTTHYGYHDRNSINRLKQMGSYTDRSHYKISKYGSSGNNNNNNDMNNYNYMNNNKKEAFEIHSGINTLPNTERVHAGKFKITNSNKTKYYEEKINRYKEQIRLTQQQKKKTEREFTNNNISFGGDGHNNNNNNNIPSSVTTTMTTTKYNNGNKKNTSGGAAVTAAGNNKGAITATGTSSSKTKPTIKQSSYNNDNNADDSNNTVYNNNNNNNTVDNNTVDNIKGIIKPEEETTTTTTTIVDDIIMKREKEITSSGMSVTDVMRTKQKYLTNYEKSEIFNYRTVYYLGNPKRKFARLKTKPKEQENIFDDDRGDFIVSKSDHIAYRYEIHSLLGQGSFGKVLECTDHKTGEKIALKIIRNRKRFHKQAKIEAKILQHLRDNDQNNEQHIIHMKERFYFRNHLCVTFPLMGLNLYEYLKKHNFKGEPLPVVKIIANQLLKALNYSKGEKIIHCDLKPENILLTHDNKLPVCVIDFGSSCYEHERIYTYIQSRFYRSPEVMLGIPYGYPIDMWSFGCILAEMLTGAPLFAGENELDQFQSIMEIRDVPPPALLNIASRKKDFFRDDGKPILEPNSRNKTRIPNTKDFAKVLRNCQDQDFLSFLDRCLDWDPRTRLTPEEALCHEWITSSSSSNNQISCNNKITERRRNSGSGSIKDEKQMKLFLPAIK